MQKTSQQVLKQTFSLKKQNKCERRAKAGFVWVMENLESHRISYFNFQAWKVMEFKRGSWKVMETQ